MNEIEDTYKDPLPPSKDQNDDDDVRFENEFNQGNGKMEEETKEVKNVKERL